MKFSALGSVTLFLVLISHTNICIGATIYVDQSGGGDYTTINAGIDAAYTGDTIMVGPGEYTDPVVVDKNLNIIGSGPKFTVIKSNTNGITVEANWAVNISNFTITALSYGIRFSGSNSLSSVSNCIISGCGITGISTYGAYSSRSNISYVNNTIIYNADDGIRQNYGTALVQGNIIAFNGNYGIGVTNGVVNNSYNDVFVNNVADYYGAIPGTGDIALNPLFIDHDNGNFALSSTSPAIDKGIVGEPYNDPDGSRNDMGAYSGPASAAFWPYIPYGPVVTEIKLTPASVPRGGTITISAKGRVQ